MVLAVAKITANTRSVRVGVSQSITEDSCIHISFQYIFFKLGPFSARRHDKISNYTFAFSSLSPAAGWSRPRGKGAHAKLRTPPGQSRHS